MATPYNLRSRRRDDQAVQKSAKTSQAKKRKSTASKSVKKVELEHEIVRDLDQEENNEFLTLETKKRLTWEDEKEEEVVEKQTVMEVVEKQTMVVEEEEGGEEAEVHEMTVECSDHLCDRESDGEGESDGVGECDGEGESDGEGPEDVSSSAAKEQAMQQQHQQKLESENKRKSLKEKRRNKHQLYQQQKEAKRQHKRLERFNEEDLKIVAATLSASKEDKLKSKGQVIKDKSRNKQKQKRKTTTAKGSSSVRRVGDIQVVAIATETSGQPCAAAFDGAKEFLKNHLYGNHCHRAPALSLQAKKYKSRPARNFHQTITK